MQPDAPDERNVLGGPLQPCGIDPVTGFYRDGHCSTGPEDLGSHTVCAVVSADFLAMQRDLGNDLSRRGRSTASRACGRATGGASSPSAGCRPTRRARPRASSWPPPTSGRWRSCRSRRCGSTPSTSPTTSADWSDVVVDLFAGIPVADYDRAVDWYGAAARLGTGLPAERHRGRVGGRRAPVRVHRGAAGARGPRDAHALRRRPRRPGPARSPAAGSSPPSGRPTRTASRKVTYRDPDGNEIGFGGAPLE